MNLFHTDVDVQVLLCQGNWEDLLSNSLYVLSNFAIHTEWNRCSVLFLMKPEHLVFVIVLYLPQSALLITQKKTLLGHFCIIIFLLC